MYCVATHRDRQGLMRDHRSFLCTRTTLNIIRTQNYGCQYPGCWQRCFWGRQPIFPKNYLCSKLLSNDTLEWSIQWSICLLLKLVWTFRSFPTVMRFAPNWISLQCTAKGRSVISWSVVKVSATNKQQTKTTAKGRSVISWLVVKVSAKIITAGKYTNTNKHTVSSPKHYLHILVVNDTASNLFRAWRWERMEKFKVVWERVLSVRKWGERVRIAGQVFLWNKMESEFLFSALKWKCFFLCNKMQSKFLIRDFCV